MRFFISNLTACLCELLVSSTAELTKFKGGVHFLTKLFVSLHAESETNDLSTL